MKKKAVTLMIVAMLLVTLIPTLASASYTRYIYSQNGKGVHIRYGPSTDADVLCTADFGTKVTVVRNLGTGWSEIYWGGDDRFYIMTRFLVKSKPSKSTHTESSSSSKKQSSGTTAAAAASASSIQTLNNTFKTFKAVSVPYFVTVHPSRASGVVYVRFAPSKETDVLFAAREGKELSVIGELDGWYQVQDPDTGSVGYVIASRVSR